MAVDRQRGFGRSLITKDVRSADTQMGDFSDSNEKYNDHSYDIPGARPARVDGSDDRIFALDSGVTKRSTFETKSTKAEEKVRRIKRHWYPVLLLSIALNTFLLIGVFYIIYEADYYNMSKAGYLWRACLIVFLPLVPTTFLLFWPYSDWWTEKRTNFSERKSSLRWRNIVNILNAVACFVFVLTYLLTSAIPSYNSPTWITQVDFSGDMPVPAIAMVTVEGPTTLAPARFADREADGTSTEVPANVSSLETSLESLLSYTAPDQLYRQRVDETAVMLAFDAIVSNSSLVQPTIQSPLQYALIGSARLTYNDSNLNPLQRSLTGTAPIMLMAAFDPRLTLREVMLCGIVQTSPVNAFAQNNMLMSVSTLSDPRRKMVRPSTIEPACERVYGLLETASPPIAQYDLRVTSSQSTTTNFSQECKAGEVPGLTCLGGFVLAYSSQFITTQVSMPGKSKEDIWIDCGAIVGAVQFFSWFLLVFFQE